MYLGGYGLWSSVESLSFLFWLPHVYLGGQEAAESHSPQQGTPAWEVHQDESQPKVSFSQQW